MKRLGQILIDHGKISNHQLDFCLKVQQNNGKTRLGKLLKFYDFAKEFDVAKALSQQAQWPFFEGEYVVDEAMLEMFGIDFFQLRCIFPLKSFNGPSFVFSSGEDVVSTDLIQHKLMKNCLFYIGEESQIKEALVESLSPKNVKVETQDVLKWFDYLLEEAVRLQASDIHIEPSKKAVECRLRVNGLLRFYDTRPLIDLSRIINIIFNKADVTVGDFFHFHDAHFSQIILGKNIDCRVSHIPSVNGSSVVMRLLEKDRSAVALTDLGYSQTQWLLIEEALVKPHGITLIVGPTGCGKTTSLYAMLNHIKDLTKKIVTIEDPVEMPLPLITQVQVNESRDISFQESIRAILRHDPDIILIGEVRDADTAHQAIRASITGHKVFATLHTNRAVDAVFRMIDLGVESFLLSQSLTMVIAQRLVRKLCVNCRILEKKSKNDSNIYERKYFDHDYQDFFKSLGCDSCEQGFSGRTVVAEIFVVNEEIQAIIACRNWDKLMTHLNQQDVLFNFTDSAKLLLKQGITSLKEITRVLG